MEARLILSERVVVDQEGHHVTTGEKLHDEIEELGVLEGIVKLDDPLVVSLIDKQIPFRTNVGQLKTRRRNRIKNKNAMRS